MANVPYANEKLSKAMRLLITGIGPIRQRLEAAFLAASTLQPGDFPDNQTRDLWLEIRGVLTSVPGPGGSLRETLAQMSNEQVRRSRRATVALGAEPRHLIGQRFALSG